MSFVAEFPSPPRAIVLFALLIGIAFQSFFAVRAAASGNEDRLFEQCEDGAPDQAIGACTLLLQTGVAPTAHVTARSFRGLAFLAKEQYASAIADFTEAIKLTPITDDMIASNLTGRAKAFNELDQYDPAIADTTRAISLTSSRRILPYAYLQRGFANFVKKAHFDLIVSDMSKSLDLGLSKKDDLILAYMCRGFAYEMLAKPEQAIHDFDALLELSPQNADALDGRGIMKKTLGLMLHSPSLIADGEQDIAAAKAIDPSIK